MDYNLLMKLIKGGTPTDAELANELYEICDNVHSSCSFQCPMYQFKKDSPDCPFFKKGKEMLTFLRNIPDCHTCPAYKNICKAGQDMSCVKFHEHLNLAYIKK
jgi:hypothetical protein